MEEKNKPLTYEAIVELDKRLDCIPLGELPRIYDEVNLWRWPLELGEPLSLDYKEGIDCPETSYIMSEIERRCGNKAIWRYQKTEKENYTPQMFEDWYNSNFIVGEPKSKFYESLVREFHENQCHSHNKNSDIRVWQFSWFILLLSNILLLIKIFT